MKKPILFGILTLIVLLGVFGTILSIKGQYVLGKNNYPNLKESEKLSFDDSPTIRVIIPYVDKDGNEQFLITDNKKLRYERDRIIEEYGLDFLKDAEVIEKE